MENYHQLELIILNLTDGARFRRVKAEEYPMDAERNLNCAAQLDLMANRLTQTETGPNFSAFCELEAERATEAFQEIAGSIHFVAVSPEGFFAAVLEAAK